MPAIVWFRSDLRIHDNPALTHAAKSGKELIFLYIDEGNAKRRIDFVKKHSLKVLKEELRKEKIPLIVRKGDAASVLLDLIEETKAKCIYANSEYDPFLMKRDKKLKMALLQKNIPIEFYHGNLLVDPFEILKIRDKPFRTFASFWKILREYFSPEKPLSPPKTIKVYQKKLTSLEVKPSEYACCYNMGFKAANAKLDKFLEKNLVAYPEKRSLLSAHLTVGDISPKVLWHKTPKTEEGYAFLRQLAWREFSYHMLIFYPDMIHAPLKPEFQKFPWRYNDVYLQAWQEGRTGYPIIDAAMRELKETGFISNPLRMATASFLVKDLLIPWQEGAKWFLDHLVDADIANNTLNWQWVSGTGVDSAPYFRIFNPTLQAKKIDPSGEYIRKYVPELKNLSSTEIHTPWEARLKVQNYPPPIINHASARKKALEAFELVKK